LPDEQKVIISAIIAQPFGMDGDDNRVRENKEPRESFSLDAGDPEYSDVPGEAAARPIVRSFSYRLAAMAS
jgi:hypothetical protein